MTKKFYDEEVMREAIFARISSLTGKERDQQVKAQKISALASFKPTK